MSHTRERRRAQRCGFAARFRARGYALQCVLVLRREPARWLCKGKNFHKEKQTNKNKNKTKELAQYPATLAARFSVNNPQIKVWCSLGLSAVPAYLRVGRSRVHVQVGICQRFSIRVAATGAYIHGPSGDIFREDLAC